MGNNRWIEKKPRAHGMDAAKVFKPIPAEDPWDISKI